MTPNEPTLDENDFVFFREPDLSRGGQHTGYIRRDITVRHIPTGICVRADDAWSQWENRGIALRKLKDLLALREQLESHPPLDDMERRT